jgi:predicted DNA-binding transcriptional regulator AlpA
VTETYLDVAAVAARYGYSPWTIYETSRLGQIPHRKHPGGRKLLFSEPELTEWDNGAVDLEFIKLPRGGRIVRPKQIRA